MRRSAQVRADGAQRHTSDLTVDREGKQDAALPALAAELAGLAGEARRRIRRHGLVYTTGVIVSFWILAGLLLAARAGGAELGWGFQLQSPTVIAALAGLFDAGASGEAAPAGRAGQGMSRRDFLKLGHANEPPQELHVSSVIVHVRPEKVAAAAAEISKVSSRSTRLRSANTSRCGKRKPRLNALTLRLFRELEVAEEAIFEGTGVATEDEHTGGGAIGEGLLSDELVGQTIIEF